MGEPKIKVRQPGYEYYQVSSQHYYDACDALGIKPDYVLLSFLEVPTAKKKDGTLRTNTKKYANFQRYLKCEHKLLDCGVFNFYNQGNFKTTRRWLIEYATQYAEFIKKYGFKDWECFELDIGAFVGYDYDFKERLNEYIESICGVKLIKIWHLHCDLERWERWCKSCENGRVSFAEYRCDSDPGVMDRMKVPLYEIAKKYNCKIHGLGYTSAIALSTDTHYTDSGDSSTLSRIARYPAKSVQQFELNGCRCFRQADIRNENRDQKVIDYLVAIDDLMEDIGGARYFSDEQKANIHHELSWDNGNYIYAGNGRTKRVDQITMEGF